MGIADVIQAAKMRKISIPNRTMPTMRSTFFGCFASTFSATRAPHLGHILVSGVVGAPQLEQKLVPFTGLAPQLGQNSGLPISSLPQFLQNMAYLFIGQRWRYHGY